MAIESKTARTRDLREGDVLVGKYRLIRLLGEGGMGGVWLAENVDLHAEVAIKLLNRGTTDETLQRRLMSEARTMASLNHPGIVRVFDHGKTEHGDPFIAMEVLRGETLGATLTKRERIPPVELVQTLLPVVEALHFAHGQGVIHRDLKPDNVFVVQLEGAPYPKLLDFGIAKRRTELGDFRLTRVDTVVGSPYYMSPEQAKGESDLDGRSDVFVLCVMMYECLTGRVPFSGDDYNAIMWAVVDASPEPIMNHGVDEPLLWSIMRRGLAKNKEERWGSAREIGEALALWLREQGVEEDIAARALRSSWLPPGKVTAQLPILEFQRERAKSGERRSRGGPAGEPPVPEYVQRAGVAAPWLLTAHRGVVRFFEPRSRRRAAAAAGLVLALLAGYVLRGGKADPGTPAANSPVSRAVDGSTPAPSHGERLAPTETPPTREADSPEGSEVLDADEGEAPSSDESGKTRDAKESKSKKRRAAGGKRVDPFDFGF